ncbi:Acetyltransferase (GNAT) family protein [Agrococcus baldri]|uniref:Acetyltransferase (GNAT) family protein n=1 Tax=Agrococcus baldri TaxID=153730 RepID=A0AA94HP97_9MICO|nr:GNAT family N-acetyltransferase [Agrococcus baldri]SFS18216.1 Acetyltransferase (GNAT) family protein [Agrococcus baldri]
MEDELRIVPANRASPADLDAIFGSRGNGSRCRCQRYRLERGETFAGTPVEERATRLRDQTSAGEPDASATTGLVAYLGQLPVGWAAVAPRSEHQGLVREFTVPWKDRDEHSADASVWAITCLFVRAGHRRSGISRELAAAAVAFARERGARAVEAYPITTTAVIEEELHVGTLPTFEAAGLTEVSHPTKRRKVLRADFA